MGFAHLGFAHLDFAYLAFAHLAFAHLADRRQRQGFSRSAAAASSGGKVRYADAWLIHVPIDHGPKRAFP